MRILISGAGIAGPTLAYWLLRYGFQPTLVEDAPRLRTGGYLIDFWGLGFDIAEKMGIVPALMQTGYIVKDIKFVDTAGRRVGGFSAAVFKEATKGRYVSLPRGELARAIYRTIEGQVETIFGDRITQLVSASDCVHVKFEHAAPRDFDLVVGADGLHSNVRRLMFGTSARGETDLGYGVAAFELAGYHPRDELTYVSYNCPGKQVARFAMNGDRTLILLVFARDGAAGAGAEELRSGTDLGAPRRELHRLFDNAGWECAQIMEAMDTCESIYFDRVCQIHLDSWSADRCVLIGDAAACASLLAGQGSALAMMAAYVLAGELRRAKGDHRAACAAYEKRLRPFIEAKQKAAAQVASAFAPRTELGILFRNVVTKAMRFSFIADLAIGRSLKDDLVLPDYAA